MSDAENQTNTAKGQSELTAVVSWPPPKSAPDDAVFIYRNNDGKALVYGMLDARRHQKELFAAGYKHTATIKASVLLENAINSKDIHDVWDMINGIDS